MESVRKSFHENATIEVTRKGCVGKESSRRRENEERSTQRKHQQGKYHT